MFDSFNPENKIPRKEILYLRKITVVKLAFLVYSNTLCSPTEHLCLAPYPLLCGSFQLPSDASFLPMEQESLLCFTRQGQSEDTWAWRKLRDYLVLSSFFKMRKLRPREMGWITEQRIRVKSRAHCQSFHYSLKFHQKYLASMLLKLYLLTNLHSLIAWYSTIHGALTEKTDLH